MAQERTFIAVRWIALCKPGDDRYVIKNRETDEVVDDNHGKGYQSPKAAHASFAFKQKYRGWKSSGTPDGNRENAANGTNNNQRGNVSKNKRTRKPNNTSSNKQINVEINAQNKKAINQHGLFD